MVCSAIVWQSASVSPSITTSAPKERVAAIFTKGVGAGMTMVAWMPRRRACQATAWAWLPADMAMTPRARSSAVSASILISAPRSLNEAVACRFSYFTQMSAPVACDRRGAGRNGVRMTTPAINSAAARISVRVGRAMSGMDACSPDGAAAKSGLRRMG